MTTAQKHAARLREWVWFYSSKIGREKDVAALRAGAEALEAQGAWPCP